MPRNPELDHEYREDKPKDDAQKRAAHASLFYMEMPDGNPLMNEPDPVDPERMAALRRTSKKPWRIVGGRPDCGCRAPCGVGNSVSGRSPAPGRLISSVFRTI